MSRSNTIGIPVTRIKENKHSIEHILANGKVYNTYQWLTNYGFLARATVEASGRVIIELRDVFTSKTVAAIEKDDGNIEDMFESLITDEGGKHV